MNDIEAQYVITRLEQFQARFDETAKGKPELFHAVIYGAAIHYNSCARECLKRFISMGGVYQENFGSINVPCGFFFGSRQIPSESVLQCINEFSAVASAVYDLLCDDDEPLYALPKLPGWLLDYGKAGALLWWIYWLGDEYKIKRLQAVRGRLILKNSIVPGRQAIFLPNGTGMIDDGSTGFTELRQAIENQEIEPDGEIAPVSICPRNVFIEASLGIELLIRHIKKLGNTSTPPSITEVNRQETEGGQQEMAGNNRMQEAIKRRGRKPLSPMEAKKRQEFYDDWIRAKGSGVALKDFANDKGIALKTAQKWINGCSKKKSRTSG